MDHPLFFLAKLSDLAKIDFKMDKKKRCFKFVVAKFLIFFVENIIKLLIKFLKEG